LLVLRERIALLIFGDGTRLTKAEYINAMPYIRLDSFTIEPNADIRSGIGGRHPAVPRDLHQCDEVCEGLDDESAVVEHVCAPQWQVVERALSGDTRALSIGAEQGSTSACSVGDAAVHSVAPGHTTSFSAFDPKQVFVHDFWEEVYIVEGSHWDGDRHFKKGMYACRPPGMKHGPYRTDEGVVTFEVRYMR
jgi:hypothetical protein